MKNFPRQLTHGSGSPMVLDPTRLLIAFREPVDREAVEARVGEFDLGLEDTDDVQPEAATRPFEVINHTDRRFWVRTRNGEPIDEERFEGLRGALGESLEWIGPVYRLGDAGSRGDLLCPIPTVLLVRTIVAQGRGELRALDRRLRQYELREINEKSEYLGEYRYFVTPDADENNAYRLGAQLFDAERDAVRDVQFENMPMVVPTTATPNDPLFARQWSMTRIGAGGAGTTGWDLSTGAPGVIVCVLDQGCDLTHPDLAFAAGAVGQGINLGTMAPTGAPTGPHGTACAGIAVGSFHNAAGVAGVAGTCTLMPVAFQNWTDAECAAGINWAAANGASVISMSFGVYAPGDGFGPTGWNFGVIDPAITNAVNVRGCVLVAATGNENTGAVNRYPARNPLVVAVGGSDQADNRKTLTSADGECWGANFGPGMSVVAPCILNPTTDVRAGGGYNTNNGGPVTVACVNYPVGGDAAGDYFFQFNGTSSATPHVAGLAAAIRSRYPALTNLQVRDLIERTARKVGGTYADAAGFPNGTRTAQMGYGRVDMFRALDAADAFVRDWPGDNAVEPSSPPGGNFWTFSDIVVRGSDDSVFNPGDPSQSSNVERGQTNYIYVRVTNNGSADARNVTVGVRITPYVGLQFVYPADWTATDATHVSPTPVTAAFPSIAAGASAIAKFTISSAQVATLWGWISGMNWHPCLLAVATADNDYAFSTANTGGTSLVVRRNNLAQRNLSVIDVVAGAAVTFPFIAGNRADEQRSLELVIDRRRLDPGIALWLVLDDDGRAFPELDLTHADARDGRGDDGIVFLERTKVEATLGGCRGILTLAKGSRFDCGHGRTRRDAAVLDGEIAIRDGRPGVDVRGELTVLRIAKEPGELLPLAMRLLVPAEAATGASYQISVAQRDEREQIVGGATVVYRVG